MAAETRNYLRRQNARIIQIKGNNWFLNADKKLLHLNVKLILRVFKETADYGALLAGENRWCFSVQCAAIFHSLSPPASGVDVCIKVIHKPYISDEQMIHKLYIIQRFLGAAVLI